MGKDGFHIPVLLDKVLEYLSPKQGDIVFDGTLGGAGHTAEIIKAIAPTGKVIGVDLHSQTLSTAANRLGSLAAYMIPVNDNFANISQILRRLGIREADGILLDLGLSSFLIDSSGRGFSYRRDEALDMRFSGSQDLTAADVVNSYSREKLEKVFIEYGEERFSRRIAGNIEKRRKHGDISTTGELAAIIRGSIPPGSYGRRRGDPAKRVFQAIRIEVNRELENLEKAIDDGFQVLKTGGRMVIISYHSLEDRMVKTMFKEFEGICTCPPGLPVCRCGAEKRAETLTRGAVMADESEIKQNPRSGSARLRALKKV
jgi:16S rRNA (cytosine1402-N4)-methyltransferase